MITKTKMVNGISALAIVFALGFSTNANAVGGGGYDRPSKPKNCGKCHKHSHYGKCKPGNGGGDPTPTPSVPLDGGLGFLVLGAAAFGVKKLRGNKKA
ncbi:PID-CTERM protein-sorting domain-containing protein [Algibacter miyuki]|uniref:PID-CTERM protein-sorting domain-containing protein n=1 Tax=Algibacter miyuki TaxID=1306933 RepID=A0ABV5H408_9FLAO|nr:hypothetical protein [Algibacter miyuki]MDN3665667.1 hypothetical protein [Algibacter miyuki]